MDLVSGRDVLLKIESIGAAVAQRAWAEGCARWYARRHPREPTLHDYGVIGERLRFEAIEPAGTRWQPDATANRAPFGGHVLQPRIAVARVAAWLDEPGDDRVRDVYICGPAGSGLATTGHLIAREARLLGFVPVHAAALASFSGSVRDHAIDLLRERHLLVLRDASAPHEAEGMVLGRLARRAERPLVLVTLTRTAAPAGSVFVALDPLDDGALARLIGGADAAARHRRRFRACVERSEGWPGRFLDAWRRTSDTRYTIRPQRALIAAERAAAYGSGEAVLDETAGEELAGEALAQAERLAGVGRHAAARAALKTCAGQLERRGAHRLLTRVRWALGRLAFDRGRVEEAIALFDHARDGFHAQGDEPRQTAATADLCRALVERGDLRRAESLARMTLAMGAASPPIAVCLAEALYWQGCYDEAEERLIGAGGTDDLATSALQARVALARGEIVEAGVCAQRALDCAGGAPDASRVSALVAAILVSGAVADTGRVAEHAAEGLRLARRAHQPRAAFDVRLARVEALARANDRRAARLAARGLARFRSTATPRLVRARIAAVMSALDGSPVAAHDLEGLNALIDLRAVLSGDGPPATRRRVRDDLRDLLDLAHDAPDETSALQRMASFVSRAVRHASVVVYGGEAPDVRAVAGSHVLTGPVPDVARRTMAVGILVGPSRERDGVDVGCPIRFGGATIGTVFCRWMVEGPLDWTRIEVLLTAAACAAGPCLRGAHGRRVRRGSVSPRGARPHA